MSYKVHIGYTLTGRNRWRHFATLTLAALFCGTVHEKTGIVLSIVRE